VVFTVSPIRESSGGGGHNLYQPASYIAGGGMSFTQRDINDEPGESILLRSGSRAADEFDGGSATAAFHHRHHQSMNDLRLGSLPSGGGDGYSPVGLFMEQTLKHRAARQREDELMMASETKRRKF
jgi:hypothetical protein